MTIETQAYLRGYLHEKTAAVVSSLTGEEVEKWWQRIQPVEKLSQEMDELNFQMRAMSPEEQAVAIQKHSELEEQRDMLEAQIYAEHGYEYPKTAAPKRKSILDRVKGFFEGEEQWKGSANSQYPPRHEKTAVLPVVSLGLRAAAWALPHVAQAGRAVATGDGRLAALGLGSGAVGVSMQQFIDKYKTPKTRDPDNPGMHIMQPALDRVSRYIHFRETYGKQPLTHDISGANLSDL